MTEPIGVAQTIGGQVPLLKHAIMQWLRLARERGNGTIHGTNYDIAEDTKASVTNTARALWDLQKQGLLKFRERKGAGINGHGSTTVLTAFTLTPRGLTWDAGKAVMTDLAHVTDFAMEQMNPGIIAEVDADEIASDMRKERMRREGTKVAVAINAVHHAKPVPDCTCGHAKSARLPREKHLKGCPWAAAIQHRTDAVQLAAKAVTRGRSAADITKGIEEIMEVTRAPFTYEGKSPAQALADLLRYEGGTMSLPIREANVRLGYQRKSTALYSLAKHNPEAFSVADAERGHIRFVGPADWVAPTGVGTGGRPRTNEEIREHNRERDLLDVARQHLVMREARASVALDHDEREGTHYMGDGHDHGGAITVKPSALAGVQAILATLPVLPPTIRDLQLRQTKRAKVAEAVAALEAAGLDDDALTVMGRIPDDTDLERDVLTFLHNLGYAS